MKSIGHIIFLLVTSVFFNNVLYGLTEAYVSNNSGTTVSVIDTTTNLVTSITVGNGPQFIAVSSDGTRAYVTNSGDNSISVINTQTHTVVQTIPLAIPPFFLAVTPDGAELYVAGSTSNMVAVIDTSSFAVTYVPVGSNPQYLAITPDGAQVYVANFDSANVSVIDTSALTVNTITTDIGSNPQYVAISPNGAVAYVSNNASNNVSVINTSTNVVDNVIPVGTSPFFIVFTPDSLEAYVTNVADASVSAINTLTELVTDTIPVGSTPLSIFVLPNGTQVFTPDASGSTISAINTASKLATPIAIGNNPIFGASTPDSLFAYVTNQTDGTVSVINTLDNSVENTLVVGAGPLFIAMAQVPPPSPTVTNISPNVGPATGGTSVTITGTNFIDGDTQVFFGLNPASNIMFISSTTLTVTAPPGSGIVDVTVTTPSGTSPIVLEDQYTYLLSPVKKPRNKGGSSGWPAFVYPIPILPPAAVNLAEEPSVLENSAPTIMAEEISAKEAESSAPVKDSFGCSTTGSSDLLIGFICCWILIIRRNRQHFE